MAINIPILVSIFAFYALIFLVGIWAARVTRRRKSATASETMTVGARDVGVFLGTCTLIATFYGGGALNGTAEAVYGQGLLWAFAVPGYGVSLILAGILFVPKMRDSNYVTSLDPFVAKYGKYSALIFFSIEVLTGVLYNAAILVALGGTLEVITGLHRIPSVIISAVISLTYTMIGGLYSVAYTDVIQLLIICLGLVLSMPFAFTNGAVTSISETAQQGWLGTWNPDFTGSYVDLWLLVLLGGMANTQILYQRVYSVGSTRKAQALCVCAGILTPILAIPPMLIGAIGASTNWTMTSYINGTGVSPRDLGDQSLILPIVLVYLTPPAVAFFGLGAVSAAIMSSVDSAVLAGSTLFGRNIYRKIIRPRASEREILISIRVFMVLLTATSCATALAVDTILALFFLCADLLYVITLPQFVSVIYLDPNAYGLIPSVIIGLVLRIGGGELLLNWPAPFPYVGGRNFPHKTVAMFSTFITLTVFSYLAKFLFAKGYIPEKYDILHSKLARGGRTRFLDIDKATSKNDSVDLPEIHANVNVE